MVTDWNQYIECLDSYRSHGFDEDACEFLVLDNSAGNRADAFIASNEFLQAARGRYIVLTHQDVTLIDHGRPELEKMLQSLTRLDPYWGVAGNAGFTHDGLLTLCISHPHKEVHVLGGPFPRRVISLDENFLVIRKVANLALSRDLGGFHHYGVDICTVADVLGWNAYVIGFFLRHHSAGNVDAIYDRSQVAFIAKYESALRPRWVHLITWRSFYLAGNGKGVKRAQWMRFFGKVGRRIRRLGRRHSQPRA